MKKITLLCLALIAGFSLQAQEFTSTTSTGTTVYNSPAGTTTQQINGQNATVITITHSATQTIEEGADIACASPTSFRDNNMFREFDLGFDFGISVDFYVTNVEIAIGPVVTPAGFPLTVNIYSADAGDFPRHQRHLLRLDGDSQDRSQRLWPRFWKSRRWIHVPDLFPQRIPRPRGTERRTRTRLEHIRSHITR